MINDFIKGKQQYTYSIGIQKGFSLHRAIDTFTDAHEATREIKTFFRPQYRLYAGAFGDVVYDHFLARDTSIFDTPAALQQFAHTTYDLLTQHQTILPQRFAQMLPYMRQQDWLYNYRLTSGIQQSFNGLVRRSTYLSESAIAYEVFLTNYQALNDCYTAFFPDLKKYSVHQLGQLTAD
jgi:acyl carrier protein phosphodiesterase